MHKRAEEGDMPLDELLGAARWRLRRDPVLGLPEGLPAKVPLSVVQGVLRNLAGQYARIGNEWPVHRIIMRVAEVNQPTAQEAVDAVIAAWICDQARQSHPMRSPQPSEGGAVVLLLQSLECSPMVKLAHATDLNGVMSALGMFTRHAGHLESLWSMVRSLLQTIGYWHQGMVDRPFSYAWTGCWISPEDASRLPGVAWRRQEQDPLWGEGSKSPTRIVPAVPASPVAVPPHVVVGMLHVVQPQGVDEPDDDAFDDGSDDEPLEECVSQVGG